MKILVILVLDKFIKFALFFCEFQTGNLYLEIMKHILNEKYKYFISLFILSLLCGILVKLIRTNGYFIQSQIFNSLPSFFASFGLCMLVLAVVKKSKLKTMGFVMLGLLVYEVEQIWTSYTFDVNDIIATVLGYALSVLTLKILNMR